MAKKDEFTSPDYEKVKSIEQIEKNILECQRIISRKYKLRVQSESGRRDMVASYNDQIKHLKEELDHELGVLSAWEDRKKIVSVQGATEDEEPGQDDVQTPGPAPIPVSAPIMVAPAPSVPQPVASSIPLPPAAPPPPPVVLQATGQVPVPGGSMIPFPRKASAAS